MQNTRHVSKTVPRKNTAWCRGSLCSHCHLQQLGRNWHEICDILLWRQCPQSRHQTTYTWTASDVKYALVFTSYLFLYCELCILTTTDVFCYLANPGSWLTPWQFSLMFREPDISGQAHQLFALQGNIEVNWNEALLPCGTWGMVGIKAAFKQLD